MLLEIHTQIIEIGAPLPHTIYKKDQDPNLWEKTIKLLEENKGVKLLRNYNKSTSNKKDK